MSATKTSQGSLPSLKSLQTFDLVGQIGGIRKAARALQIDHTAASRRLVALETFLQVQLLTRTATGLTLTEAGARYHIAISTALRLLEDATQCVALPSGLRDLHVWAVPGLAAQWLSGQLAEFDRQSPGFTIELRPTDRVADLARYEADADIRFYGDGWGHTAVGSGLKGIELARPDLIAVASPLLISDLGPLDTIAALRAAPLLHEENREQWSAWLRANGLEAGAPDGGLIMWHAHLAIAAAREGRGVALANTFLLASDLDEQSLVRLDIPGCQNVAVGGYWFLCREDRWSDPSIQALRRFIRKRFGEHVA